MGEAGAVGLRSVCKNGRQRRRPPLRRALVGERVASCQDILAEAVQPLRGQHTFKTLNISHNPTSISK
jgi:hypothetical protein